VYPVVFVIYLSSPDVILLGSLALMVQFSIQYNKAGRTTVFCSFILVFFEVFCGLNTLLITPVIFNIYSICYHFPLIFHKMSNFLSTERNLVVL